MSDPKANMEGKVKNTEDNKEKGQQRRRNGMFIGKPIDLSSLSNEIQKENDNSNSSD